VIILFKDFSNPHFSLDQDEITDIRKTLKTIDERLLTGFKFCEEFGRTLVQEKLKKLNFF